ncbi:hypothetical protein Tco_0632732 [Tanacetum coccineum]
MDDLYNNLKIYEDEIMGSSSTNQNTQNVAFMSSNITSNTNEAVKIAHGVSAANSKNNASTLPNVDSLSDAMISSFFSMADGNTDNKSKEISQEDGKESRQSSSRAAVSVNTARPINIAYTRPTVNSARPASNVFNKAHSHVRRPFNKFTTNKNSNFKEKVNTVRENVTTVGPKAVVSDNKGNEANVVKASACWVGRPDQKVLDHGNPQLELQEKGVIDSGCSRHMTGNKSYLSDYEEIDGGFVAFGGNPKGGKITGKDTEYVVLSPNFKLLDKNQVLLRVPRKNNMYNVDLKNVVPLGGLTCLFAKATLDESNL